MRKNYKGEKTKNLFNTIENYLVENSLKLLKLNIVNQIGFNIL